MPRLNRLLPSNMKSRKSKFEVTVDAISAFIGASIGRATSGLNKVDTEHSDD